MKLTALQYFLTVAKYNSFTKASEKLYITQPTISRQIQELEDELGTSLFERTYKQVHLTENGKLVKKEAKEILDRIDRLSRMFRSEEVREVKKTRRLRIGYQKNFNSQQVYDVMQKIMFDNPELDFLLSQQEAIRLWESLNKDRVDAIFILNIFLPQDVDDFHIITFEQNRLQLVVHENKPLGNAVHVSFRQLKDETFIMINRSKSPVIADYVTQLCMNNGFSPHVEYYIDDVIEGLELVAARKGISFLHSNMNIEIYSKNYHVKMLDIDEVELKLDFVAVCKKSNYNVLMEQLFDALNIENI